MQPSDRNKVTVMTAGGAGRSYAAVAKLKAPPPETAPLVAQHQPPFHDDDDDDQGDNHHHKKKEEVRTLEMEETEQEEEEEDDQQRAIHDGNHRHEPYSDTPQGSTKPPPSTTSSQQHQHSHSELVWLAICFSGIMASFVCYGLLLEYTTSGGRQLHELSFLFVTSGLYTLTAAAGRYVRQETPSTIPPARFAILGVTSMGSTFCSVRSLRYVLLLLLTGRLIVNGSRS
jgi:hypothetical protein